MPCWLTACCQCPRISTPKTAPQFDPEASFRHNALWSMMGDPAGKVTDLSTEADAGSPIARLVSPDKDRGLLADAVDRVPGAEWRRGCWSCMNDGRSKTGTRILLPICARTGVGAKVKPQRNRLVCFFPKPIGDVVFGAVGEAEHLSIKLFPKLSKATVRADRHVARRRTKAISGLGINPALNTPRRQSMLWKKRLPKCRTQHRRKMRKRASC